MSFDKFFTEALLSSPEQQQADDRNAARGIISKTRGFMPGRTIDAYGNPIQPGTTVSRDNDYLTPSMVKKDDNKISNNTDVYTILKNTPQELIYVNKVDNDLFITLVNKQRYTKRTIALDERGARLLKRYI